MLSWYPDESKVERIVRARGGVLHCRSQQMKKILLYIFLCLGVALVFLGATAGFWLVKDSPKKSDVIVVLAGGTDSRFDKGMALLKAGYGKVLFVNAVSDRKFFGHSPAEYAEAFVKERAGNMSERVRVCPVEWNSTVSEIQWITRCIDSVGAKSVLVVTSEAHTRRALSVMQKFEPRYDWSVAVSRDDREFGFKWWTNREWAKMTLEEAERMFWWQLVDRWRDVPHYGNQTK